MVNGVPHVSLCTTGGYYSQSSPVTASSSAVETYSTASQYFEGADRLDVTVGATVIFAESAVFDGFVELNTGTNINILGSIQAFRTGSIWE